MAQRESNKPLYGNYLNCGLVHQVDFTSCIRSEQKLEQSFSSSDHMHGTA